MPGKRSRAFKSQTFNDTASQNCRPSSDPRWDNPFSVSDQSGQSILMLGPLSPRPPQNDRERGGLIPDTEYFLDRCVRCKKRLSPHQEVYMYGDLSAYCTYDCREVQIELDKAKHKGQGQSTGTKASGSMNIMNSAGNPPVELKLLF